jgi:hypothetical protein
MTRTAVFIFCVLAIAAPLMAQTTPPDFSGVYYPFQQGRGGGGAASSRCAGRPAGGSACADALGSDRRSFQRPGCHRSLADSGVHGEVGSRPKIADERVV